MVVAAAAEGGLGEPGLTLRGRSEVEWPFSSPNYKAGGQPKSHHG